MPTALELARRRPLLTYFVLTFGISWGGVLWVLGGWPALRPGPLAQDDPRFPLVYLAMLAGPSLAALFSLGLLHGRLGLPTFWAGLTGWRVGPAWYATALLTAPFLTTAACLALSRLSPAFRPAIFTTDDWASLLLLGFVVGIGAGLFEELGWTGVATPALRSRYGVRTTGLILGVLWAAWHVLVVVWGIGDRNGRVPLALFVAVDLLTVLPAYRMLMVLAYEQTRSLQAAILMHTSLTTTTLAFTPRVVGGSLLAYDVLLATMLWAVVASLSVVLRRPRPDRCRATRVA